MTKKALHFIGYIMTLTSFIYIYWVIRQALDDSQHYRSYIEDINSIYILLTVGLYLLVLYIGALMWVFLLNKLNNESSSSAFTLIDIYAKSNISKYIPGNFMQYVGRNILAHGLGYKHSVIALSSLVETALILLTAVTLLAILYFFTDLHYDQFWLNHFNKYVFLYLLVIPFSLLLVWQLKSRYPKINGYWQSIISLSWQTFTVVFVFYILVFLLLGLMNLSILASIDTNWHHSYSDYINILFVFIISWITGFLMPGAPGGIGVREAIFIFLLSQNYDTLVITFASIIIRIINIIGDICFSILSIYLKNRHQKSS